MFTGLVEAVGLIELCETRGDLLALGVRPRKVFAPVHGESIAVNGCCLTVADTGQPFLFFHVSQETLAKTTFPRLALGDRVNLERAMRLGDRLGGHMVSGHVDAVATVTVVRDDPSARFMTVSVPAPWHRYVIPKGSICLDGVSLTVNALRDTASGSEVDLMLIPTTLAETTLADRKVGDVMNLEVDMIGKYIDRFHNVK